MQLDSTIIAALLGAFTGAIASYIALREQDVRHTAAIKVLEEKILNLKTGKGLHYRIRSSDKETLS
jgi:hypothetical protein